MLSAESVKAFFQNCYVVNLARRPDRRKRLENDVIPTWPLAPINMVNATDGQICLPPPWWKAGKGAWGVYRSHLQIIEVCLNTGVESVLILEDDALPCPDFASKVTAFLSEVPSDWGMIYLGGQHLRQNEHAPDKVSQHVYRAYNVNRLHAFAVSKAAMSVVYQWLCRRDWETYVDDEGKNQQHHIDHHLGRLHMSGLIPVYAPDTWLIAQAEGTSNICGKDLERRWWKGAAAVSGNDEQPNVIAVLGPFRSGTSCVAGILHNLGVSMGRSFFQGRQESNPTGYFEATYLREACIRVCKEPQMRLTGDRSERVKALQEWAAGRRGDGTLIGAKHPSLCLMVPAMKRAWPDVKVVSVSRDMDATFASLLKTGWWTKFPQEKKRAMLERLASRRDADLARLGVPTLALRYEDVVASPADTVSKIIQFAGISPTPDQVSAAIAHVKPGLRHDTIQQEAAA